jgi:hypothetical protein
MTPSKFELVIVPGGGKGFLYEGKEVALPDCCMVRLG